MTDRKFHLGRKPKRTDARTLQLRRYLTAALPAPPTVSGLYTSVTAPWGMDGNDQYGDCTCAAWAHAILMWTSCSNPPGHQPTEAEILAAYNIVDGGVDQGADMLTVLNYARQTGMAGDRISAFAEVEVTSPVEVQNAIVLFGACYVGVALPDVAVQGDMLATPWTQVYGPPDPSNGHCIVLVGYDDNGPWCVTWGELKQLSWAFLATYGDEGYAILSPDWISPAGESPPGFDSAQLQADLGAITGSAAPTPDPAPPAAPPAPAGHVEAALDAIFQEIDAGVVDLSTVLKSILERARKRRA